MGVGAGPSREVGVRTGCLGGSNSVVTPHSQVVEKKVKGEGKKDSVNKTKGGKLLHRDRPELGKAGEINRGLAGRGNKRIRARNRELEKGWKKRKLEP